MYGQDIPTRFTSPFFPFLLQEKNFTNFLYPSKIIDKTYPVISPVSFIQSFHRQARELLTFVAIMPPGFPRKKTILNTTGGTMFHLHTIRPTSPTWLFLSQISHTHPTIHPTRGNRIFLEKIIYFHREFLQ